MCIALPHSRLLIHESHYSCKRRRRSRSPTDRLKIVKRADCDELRQIASRIARNVLVRLANNVKAFSERVGWTAVAGKEGNVWKVTDSIGWSQCGLIRGLRVTGATAPDDARNCR